MENQFTPFESIGLCFSGGGYRATFFSLGVISYLHRVYFKDKPLLKHVEAISSVSGGSLLAVAYSLAEKDVNFDFAEWYKNFYLSFTPKNDRLLENAVAKLEKRKVWLTHPYKKRSLINAFALTYAEMDIFKGYFEDLDKNDLSSLKHVCVNATEFSYGLAFRFQNIGLFGNKRLSCDEVNQVKGQIPLGDIVASSSCFPMGFEPLVFPDDYIRDQKSTEYKNLKRLSDFTKGVGIMDGGIVDNQGIGSMMNISTSQQRSKPLDLIIVNDVGSYKMEPWLPDNSVVTSKESLKQKVLGVLKYFGMNWVFISILLVGILILLVNSMQLIKGQAWTSLYILGGILFGIGVCLSIIGAVAGSYKGYALSKLRSIFVKNVPEVLLDEVMSFQRLDIDLIKRMLVERATSGAKMINDVFLKQIRRLNYDLLYSKKELKNRRITSTVYQLGTGGQKLQYDIPECSTQVKRVGLIAAEAPTSLWWDKEDVGVDRMDCLIACGQFTTCYNLMVYIKDLQKEGITFEGMDALYTALLDDWKQFNGSNPLFAVAPEMQQNKGESLLTDV